MAHSPETKAKISAKLKARYANDPTYRAKIASTASERGKATAASRHTLMAERDQLAKELGTANAEIQRLCTENATLRDVVTRLAGGGR